MLLDRSTFGLFALTYRPHHFRKLVAFIGVFLHGSYQGLHGRQELLLRFIQLVDAHFQIDKRVIGCLLYTSDAADE